MRGKPKLFLFQACQGEEEDMGVPALGDQTDARPIGVPGSSVSLKDPVWEDMVIAFATIPGFVSWRNTTQGSWFIETLCMVFMEYSCNTSLRDMLDIVGLKFKQRQSTHGRKQSCEYTDPSPYFATELPTPSPEHVSSTADSS